MAIFKISEDNSKQRLINSYENAIKEELIKQKFTENDIEEIKNEKTN